MYPVGEAGNLAHAIEQVVEYFGRVSPGMSPDTAERRQLVNAEEHVIVGIRAEKPEGTDVTRPSSGGVEPVYFFAFFLRI